MSGTKRFDGFFTAFLPAAMYGASILSSSARSDAVSSVSYQAASHPIVTVSASGSPLRSETRIVLVAMIFLRFLSL